MAKETYGDKNVTIPLYNIGGKGLFTKELENFLLENKADIAIHSMKDVPYSLPKNLNISIIIKRDDHRDAFLSIKYKSINKLPASSKIATTSLRRKLQILYKKHDLNIIPIRGNIDSRIEKLIKNQFESIILSSAGIIRLKLYKYLQSYININDITPAIGQGTIGIESKNKNNNTIIKLLCKKTYKCIYTERYINKILYSNCLSPIGAISIIKNKYIFINTITLSNNGKTIIRSSNNSILNLYKNIIINC
jgi:hydroxymethylbilane synthase